MERDARIDQLRQALADFRPGSLFDHEAEEAKAAVRKRALLFLDARARSRHELRGRLLDLEFEEAVVDDVLDDLAGVGLLDDAAFAHEWVQQRRSLRALGDEALRRELSRRRVDAPLIDAALETGESDEEVRCRELVRSRIGVRDRERLRTERDGAHRRRLSRRLDALLTRKGYPGSLAVHVIAGELREASHDPES